MMCAACGHKPADHADRALGFRCTPDLRTSTTPNGSHLPTTKRCYCPGWTIHKAAADHLRCDEWRLYVRAAFSEAGYPVPGEAA